MPVPPTRRPAATLGAAGLCAAAGVTHSALVAERIADLDRRRQRLRDLLAAIEAHPGVLHDPACDLLERFADGG